MPRPAPRVRFNEACTFSAGSQTKPARSAYFPVNSGECVWHERAMPSSKSRNASAPCSCPSAPCASQREPTSDAYLDISCGGMCSPGGPIFLACAGLRSSLMSPNTPDATFVSHSCADLVGVSQRRPNPGLQRSVRFELASRSGQFVRVRVASTHRELHAFGTCRPKLR
jgi:hypothetical protein